MYNRDLGLNPAIICVDIRIWDPDPKGKMNEIQFDTDPDSVFDDDRDPDQ